MTVKELIDELQKIDDQGYGNYTVTYETYAVVQTTYVDHGEMTVDLMNVR